jgi:hypothetical protein
MQAASEMFHLAGVARDAFLAGVRAEPQTYADWSAGEWQVQTDGKEDGLFSPFLRAPFARAIREGVMPAELSTIGETWGAVRDTAELTYMNLVHLRRRGATCTSRTARWPKRVRNLLVTGRAIGGDRIARAATRNMACCAVAGEGAGIAAAVSVRSGAPLHRVDVGAVRAELERQGVRYR